MYIPNVELHECESVEQAGALLTRYGSSARLLAGGTDLLVDLKTARTATAHLVSLKRVAALRGIKLETASQSNNGYLRIGALTTVAEIDANPLVRTQYAPLCDATRDMATVQVRNLATIGGNLASAVPCADLPPILIVLGASVELWSAGGSRTVGLDRFFLGPRKTDIRPGEVLIAIRIPTIPPGFGAAYSRFALRNGNAIAVASVAASLALGNGGSITQARVALGAVAPTPAVVDRAAGALIGKTPGEDAFHAAALAAQTTSAPISDVRGSAEYRRELVAVLTRRALGAAAQRATESLT
ncbi:MAG: xanthine dehydrogenase family protein subunit M [Planctomycetes bacterium]|nr:xanthine dehydrogenase family protein subunit M [Planctomycetota bacterium]